MATNNDHIGNTPKSIQLEERAARAYQAFCDQARGFLPAYLPDWSMLPETVKSAWKAAAAAACK